MTGILDLIDRSAPIAEIADLLDGADHARRMDLTMGLGGGPQKRLWQLAGASAPITRRHFVPEDVGPRTEVVHEGRNTLPLPGAFTRFQKRFALPEPGADEIHGYNEGPTRKLIGPGHFIAHATEGDAEWEGRGAWVVNYFKVPDEPPVDHWPRVVPNSRGLQFLVYHQTRDFMRRVSHHVSIGAAYKKEKAMGAYFLLVRVDD